jgi:hypothetical protein
MKGIMDFLARARLVELSEDEKQAVAETATDPAAEAMVAPTAEPSSPSSLSVSELEVAEGKSFEDVFAAAAVPPSPYPAEKLLRLLEGLRAMDGATRKTAVLAMDAADDSWQITDCVSDAQKKIAALGGYKQYLGAQLNGGEQQAAAKTADIRAELEAATAAIRKQITELEQLLERKITQSAQETTSIEADLRALRETVAREVRRMDGEIERLQEIPAQFTTAAPSAN